MRIAPSGRFSREAREPDQHHRSIWLLASPHCPDIQKSPKPRAFGVLVGHMSQFTWAKASGHFAHEPKQPEDSRQVCQHQ